MSGLSNILSSNAYFIVNKMLCKKLGLVCAAIVGELYSEFDYWSKQNKLTEDGYFYCTRDNLQENTSLSPYEQRKAINKLIESEVLNTKLMGIPAVTYYKFNEEKLIELLEINVSKNSTHSCEKTLQQGVKNFDINNNNINTNNNNTRNTIINNSITRSNRTAVEGGETKKLLKKPKKTKKDIFIDKFLKICDEFDFSDDVLTKLVKFATVLTEMNFYPAEDTIRSQLIALSDKCKTDRQRIDVIDNTIIRGWKSLIYCIDDKKSSKDDRAEWDTPEMSNEQSAPLPGTPEFEELLARGEIHYF